MDKLVKLWKVKRILEREVFADGSMPSHQTLLNWIEEGVLPATRIGNNKNFYVYESELRKFIEKTQGSLHSKPH